MKTGIRSATAMWLLANPTVQPKAGEFGRWREGNHCACILGAACQAMGVARIDVDGHVRVDDSWSLPHIAADALNIPVADAESISTSFDARHSTYPDHYTWADALLLLPE